MTLNSTIGNRENLSQKMPAAALLQLAQADGAHAVCSHMHENVLLFILYIYIYICIYVYKVHLFIYFG